MRKQSKALLAVGLLVVSCVVGLLAAARSRRRSPWLEAQRLPGSLPEASLSAAERARLVETAREAARAVTIPDDCRPFIQETDAEYIVTFPVWYSRPVPGSDFYAQVVIDKASGKVLKWLGSV